MTTAPVYTILQIEQGSVILNNDELAYLPKKHESSSNI